MYDPPAVCNMFEIVGDPQEREGVSLEVRLARR